METNISLKIDQATYEALKAKAAKEDRSLASYIRYVLKQSLALKK